MNVIAYQSFGRVYPCEFRNDSQKIKEFMDNAPSKQIADDLFTKVVSDYSDESWNAWVLKTIEILETECGFSVIWDK